MQTQTASLKQMKQQNMEMEVPKVVPLRLVVEEPKDEQTLPEEEFESGDRVVEARAATANAAATMANMARAILIEYGMSSDLDSASVGSGAGRLSFCKCPEDAEECRCGCDEDSTYDPDEEAARYICLCPDDAEECRCGCESDTESEYRDTWEDKALDFDTFDDFDGCDFNFGAVPASSPEQDTVIPETPRRRPAPASTNAPVAARQYTGAMSRRTTQPSVLGRRPRLSIQIPPFPEVDELAPCMKRLTFDDRRTGNQRTGNQRAYGLRVRDEQAEAVMRYYADREVDEDDDAASIASSVH